MASCDKEDANAYEGVGTVGNVEPLIRPNELSKSGVQEQLSEGQVDGRRLGDFMVAQTAVHRKSLRAPMQSGYHDLYNRIRWSWSHKKLRLTERWDGAQLAPGRRDSIDERA